MNFSDYLNSKDLHIAVTSSSGSVVEFDKGGLQFHQTELWKQCLVICGASGPWLDHWDTVLKQITEQDCWSARRYLFINQLYPSFFVLLVC